VHIYGSCLFIFNHYLLSEKQRFYRPVYQSLHRIILVHYQGGTSGQPAALHSLVDQRRDLAHRPLMHRALQKFILRLRPGERGASQILLRAIFLHGHLVYRGVQLVELLILVGEPGILEPLLRVQELAIPRPDTRRQGHYLIRCIIRRILPYLILIHEYFVFRLAPLILVSLCINHVLVVFLVLAILNFWVASVQVLRGVCLAQDRHRLLRQLHELWCF